jgi:HrpA-like RNA helicase
MSKNIGILDPDGVNNNPFTNEPYQNLYEESDKKTYTDFAKFWTGLPVYKKVKELISDLSKTRVLVLVSGTGSGKSVLMPLYALHSLNYEGNVVMTIPKTLSVRETAIFAAKRMDVRIGTHVGYQYRGKSEKSDQTKLLFTTDGTLLARISSDPMLSDFDIVIIDEAHERSIGTDFLLLELKKLLDRRPELKIIIMSATIDESIFLDYYPKKKYKTIFRDLGSFPNYEVASHYLPRALNDPAKEYIQMGVDIMLNEIIKPDKKGDILFFVTGIADGVQVCRAIQNETKKLNNIRPFCVQLASDVSDENKKYAMNTNAYKSRNNGPWDRKIVVSTNIAEASVTVDGVVFVIECGLANIDSYDPEKNLERLEKKRITHASSIQRKGRAGRTRPGECYFLYTEEEHNKMDKYPIPQIRTSKIQSNILQKMSSPDIKNSGDIVKYLKELIEPPNVAFIKSALNSLKALNIIAGKTAITQKLTPLGNLVLNFRALEANEAKMIISSYYYQCEEEIINLVGMLQASRYDMNRFWMSKINERPINEGLLARAKGKLTHPLGDHMSLIHIYKLYDENRHKNPKQLRDWCEKQFLNYNTLRNVKDEKRKIWTVFNELKNENKFPENKNVELFNSGEDNIMQSIFLGNYINIAKGIKTGNGKYVYKTCFPEVQTTNQLDKFSLLSNKSNYYIYSAHSELFGRQRLAIVSNIPETVVAKIPEKLLEFVRMCDKPMNSNNRSNKTGNRKPSNKPGNKTANKTASRKTVKKSSKKPARKPARK